ncbi:MAG: hypothetical protein FWD51_04935 [Betaproteobacteria bacterium]|nr:hypothetical protein [Betaproteobacteria bacterium]
MWNNIDSDSSMQGKAAIMVADETTDSYGNVSSLVRRRHDGGSQQHLSTLNPHSNQDVHRQRLAHIMRVLYNYSFL